MYLGDAAAVQVYTVSGFIDPKNVEDCVFAPGWRFIIQESSHDRNMSMSN